MSSRIEDPIWADAQDFSPAEDGDGVEADCFDAIRELAFGPKTYMQLGQMAAEKLRAAGSTHQSLDAADAATLVSLTVGAFAASAMALTGEDTTVIKKI